MLLLDRSATFLDSEEGRPSSSKSSYDSPPPSRFAPRCELERECECEVEDTYRRCRTPRPLPRRRPEGVDGDEDGSALPAVVAAAAALSAAAAAAAVDMMSSTVPAGADHVRFRLWPGPGRRDRAGAAESSCCRSCSPSPTNGFPGAAWGTGATAAAAACGAGYAAGIVSVMSGYLIVTGYLIVAG